MSTPYLDHFLDSLEPLPADLQRNFALMKDLDTRTQDIVRKINKEAENYILQVNEMGPNEKTEKFEQIHQMFEKAKEYGDDKVQLAMQTYEMVDKHIRRLDTELAKFESDLKDKQINVTGSGSGGSGGGSLMGLDEGKKKVRGVGRGADKNKGSAFNPKNVIKTESDKGRRKQDTKHEVTSQALEVVSALPSIVGNTEVLDMPVDPNEPTYCLCHQVSYGEMIGCDNTDCPIEWFHFGCVGLTIKPKGKWFCPKCSEQRKKK